MMMLVDGVAIEVVTGDIAVQPDIDAVVNAANAELVSGGGVAGAIHEAAGPELAAAGKRYAPLEPGEAVATPAFDMPNRFVIHCLGPVYGEDEPADELLARCYRSALELAEKNESPSIAFPAISTGAFGYPMQDAAAVAVDAVAAELPKLQHVKLIRFVMFSDADRATLEAAWERRFPDARQ